MNEEIRKKVADYLNKQSYLKKSHIKVVQVAKDANVSMYESSGVLEDFAEEGLLQRRFEIIDKETALNYGCFLQAGKIPKTYVTDDGIELVQGENALVKVFYRFPNAHTFIDAENNLLVPTED